MPWVRNTNGLGKEGFVGVLFILFGFSFFLYGSDNDLENQVITPKNCLPLNCWAVLANGR